MKTVLDDVEDRLKALRLSLQHEHYMPPEWRYKQPDFNTDLKGLVVRLEKFLGNRGYTDPQIRRQVRLDILSYITEREVKTIYDLTKKEAQTIYKEIERDQEERGSVLMEYIEKRSQE